MDDQAKSAAKFIAMALMVWREVEPEDRVRALLSMAHDEAEAAGWSLTAGVIASELDRISRTPPDSNAPKHRV